ncbi:hypothetical protein GE061_008482 [Apolygus lucorum]|uniref:GTP-binding protein REM 1 n=1 Tax=Apolygus lucorum TaxID=248454 RepID=A0A8S9WMJ7_APOLU|nr:hypothetical protein GE061_008482 [Apolygus lucorum]
MRPSSNTCKRARPSSAGSPPAALPSTSAELPMPPPVAPPTAPPPPAHARDRRLAPPKSRTPSAARHSRELRQVENSLSTYEPHACAVIYSVVDKATFKVAEDILNYLWRESYTKEKTVILVGNKVDLARARAISTSDGKALAASRDCKFIETSSGIQHNVDELLVGILKQIRLREARELKRTRRKLHSSKTSLSLNTAKEILARMCLSDGKSKSCENLHVL